LSAGLLLAHTSVGCQNFCQILHNGSSTAQLVHCLLPGVTTGLQIRFLDQLTASSPKLDYTYIDSIFGALTFVYSFSISLITDQ